MPATKRLRQAGYRIADRVLVYGHDLSQVVRIDFFTRFYYTRIYKHHMFNRLYIFLGPLLTILITTLILSISPLPFVMEAALNGRMPPYFQFFAYFMTALFIMLLFFNFYYLVTGVVALTIPRLKEDSRPTSTFYAKRRIQRGIVGMVILFLIYCVVTGMASYYGINNNSLGSDTLFESPGQMD